MIIQHNIMAINSHRQLTVNNSNLSRNLEKLSSGYRINKAADDAAGLAISEKMRAQITALDRAVLNAQDGASLIQTAEGAMTEIHSMLNRMVELGTQSANGTIQEEDRSKIESELNDLKGEIDRISKATNFNGINLLDGKLGGYTIGTAKTGTALTASKGLITSASGATLNVKAESAITIAESSGEYTVTYTRNEPGADTTAEFKFKLANHTKYYDANGKEVADTTKGGSAVIDLTEYGLGAYSIRFDSGAVASKLGEDFTAIFANTTLPKGASAGLTLQVGETAASYNKITVSVDDMSSLGLNIANISMSTQQLASDAMQLINRAIEKVSVNRGNLGALQNRLDHTINNLGVTSENMTAAESRVRDVDMAKEMMAFTKNNVLSQAAQAMLAQANQLPQQVLQLLR